MKVEKPGIPMHDLDPTKVSKLSGKNGSSKVSSVGANALGDDGVGGADGLGGGSSKVALSNRAQMMAKAKEIASRDTIDEAKVARLQKLIDEGKYKTDSAAIADRLVDEHMSFPE